MASYEYPPHTDHTVPLPGSGTNLSVRIWPADPSPTPSPLPFLLWTHGGGFIGGSHFMPLYWLDIGFRRAHDYHLISHNYRLAPQVSLDDQLADCLHVVAWLRENLPSILGVGRVDVDRYVLAGDSAGGLLVSLMGLHLHTPAPRAIIDIYGGADFPAMLALDRKDEAPAEWKGEFPAEKLEAFLEDRDQGKVLTDALSWMEMEQFTEEELSAHWKSEVKYDERIRMQAEAHIWRSLHPMGSEMLVRAVLHPEKFETKEKMDEKMMEMSPLHALRKVAETGGRYPPTAFLHGTGDEAVPWELSREMARVLKGMGVPVVERYPEGEPHVFDRKYTSTDVSGWEVDIQPIVDFVRHHVDA
ncbi:Alpha/Beta hydrolase protein [Cercophora newfieldiana]|uniref:Alpha/Beta hydrolase protein n=1 Tax=Cercophora newfieldiana TaxID=92897 RepID=A0AA39XSJ6_9PEZI|nr:Alpha/Beta hydrolase protein [Cercophora newfieldiana]